MATKNNGIKLYCSCCDYIPRDFYNFTKHTSTAKHQLALVRQQKSLQQNEWADLKMSSCINYDHISSTNMVSIINQHESLQIPTKVGMQQNQHYSCSKCNKKYKHRSSLFKHNKQCTSTHMLEAVQNTSEFQNFMMEHTKELHNFLLEQNKTIIELSNKVNTSQNNSNNINTTNTINSHNKFNLNVFLNETCKDAMNITEFMKSIQYKLTDLENTCDLGYAEGISRIMIRGLKDIDVCKRPIHCSDLKRETIYLKVTNGWEKENESKEKLRKMIGTIANNNINQMPKWVEMHPDCKSWNNKNNSRYVNLVNASMGGADKDEDERFMNKIIHNVVKEVTIEK